MDKHSQITPIGITNYRNQRQRFGIKDKDRLQHIYVIGKSGTGKSTLLENMAISDIQRGNGLGVIDPHGDIARDLLKHIPEERKSDLIYFNATDTVHPIAFNPLHGVHPKYHHLVASGLISTFKKIWADSWGPRLEYILRYCLLTLMEYPDAALLDIQPLLTDMGFRNHVLLYVKNEASKSFWKKEFEKYSPQFRSEVISPILNKTGLFLTSIPLRNIVGQKSKGIKIQQILDERKILIVNLSKGEIGEDATSLLGAILLNSIQLAAIHRATKPENTRKPFFLYVDEMHSFISLSFVDVLAEARKYGLSLFLAHQYIDQIDERIRGAIFGNVGTLISFRVGATDAEFLEKEFFPVFKKEDFINLPKYEMYLKLMIDGATSQPFSATSIKLT
ncbi:MAG: type IV secretion system DNA-binding domain-containing protein [Chitinophagaceae bacterium]|nr:type IV secretion system DNA-binding domain-containing protein [Chitinophagaceae bacterium]